MDIKDISYDPVIVSTAKEYFDAFHSGSFVVRFKKAHRDAILAEADKYRNETPESLFAYARLISYASDAVSAERLEEARAILRRLIDEQYVPAYNLKGNSLEQGLLEPQDRASAAQWYLEAHRGGFLIGTYNLGRCYYLGMGVDQDKFTGAQYANIAAKRGYDAALKMVADQYLTGGNGDPEDPTRAFMIYKNIAWGGFKFAIVQLARCYLEGYGTEQDYRRAGELLIEASEY